MKNHLFFSFLFLWASFHGSHAQCTSYTLQNGETMSSISNGNSTLFMALINANPTINFSTATSGTTICIPTQYYSQYSLTTSTACTSYTLNSCQTYSSISNSNSALILALVNANPGINPANLPSAGTTICIPTATYSQYNLGSCNLYTVKPCDTFSSLSNGDATLINYLQNSNPTLTGNSLTIGSQICIPTCYASSYNLNSGCTYYTVKPCDTFSSLSNGNTALMTYLSQSNPGVTGTSLTVGSTICIPTCLYSSYSLNSGCTSYQVKPCDTFSSLSNGNTALMSYLAASNPGVTGTSLTVGSTICIPTCYYSSYSLNSACTAYTVKPCDTFSTLSNGNTALATYLQQANPSVTGTALTVGSTICIPSCQYSNYALTQQCTSYTVKPCDSFSSLSNGNTALMSYLTTANPSVTSSTLTVGSTICIPTCQYSSYNLNQQCTSYTVKPCDTFSSLSNGNTALATYLQQANPSVTGTSLTVGSTICIPSCQYSNYALTQQCTSYTIKPCDTLSSLSNGNTALMSYLTTANPSITTSTPAVGTTICIPTCQYSSYNLNQQCTSYTVKPCDTFSSLSNGNTALATYLQQANPSVTGTSLTAGTTICIPACYYSSYNLNSACTSYTVKACDTFSSLSNGNTALMSYLQQANPSVTGTALTVGSTICIPSCYYSSYNLNAGCTYYTVKACDTFSSLSNGNTALMSYLTAANPSVTGTSLTAGTTICIPTCYYSSYNLNSACTSYTVKACDTFSSLSNGNTALMGYLTAANPSVTGTSLTVGSTICIPSCQYSSYNLNAAGCTYYTVKPCDTFSSLSNGNTALMNYLTAANPSVTGTSLTVGSTICIPSCYYSSYNFGSGSCQYYTVKAGDTFSSLSNGNPALISYLSSANPYVNPSALTAGSQICIPSCYYSSYNLNSAATSCTYYTIKAGDTFSSLSNGNPTLISYLSTANPSVNPNAPTVGSQICIPSAYYSSYNFNSAATSCTYYTVKAGNTFSSLSNGNPTLISYLSAANPTVNPNALTVGSQICIPSAYYSSYNFNSVITTTCTSYYTIKAGDTYYSLSGGNSALISALTAANPSVNPSALTVGQQICIPSTTAGTYNIGSSSYTTGCTSYYTIKSGDTYYSLSGGNSALISALTAANPSVNPSALTVGQQICIPSTTAGTYSISGGSSSYANGCTYYTIKSGQTYYSLSRGSSALISQLTTANPSVNPSNLAVGQTICIPSQYYSSYLLY